MIETSLVSHSFTMRTLGKAWLHRVPSPAIFQAPTKLLFLKKIKEIVENGGVISDAFGAVMSSNFIRNYYGKIEQEDTKEKKKE